mmetsp:Transcript_971/g.2807  ORF Transcript_971/g.2807 Transcript_971/m.2807 type:complete len:102 (-) Transcript_971:1593-1898(-)
MRGPPLHHTRRAAKSCSMCHTYRRIAHTPLPCSAMVKHSLGVCCWFCCYHFIMFGNGHILIIDTIDTTAAIIFAVLSHQDESTTSRLFYSTPFSAGSRRWP